jgi:hypothetical protein
VSGVDERDAKRELLRQLRAKRKRGPQRSKGTFDLPAEMIEQLRAIARAERVPASDIVGLALALWLEQYEPGDLDERKRAARSPRFEWKLDLPGQWSGS